MYWLFGSCITQSERKLPWPTTTWSYRYSNRWSHASLKEVTPACIKEYTIINHSFILQTYRIAGNFRERLRIHQFLQRNFYRLLAFPTPNDATPPNFTEKTFTNSHKTVKIFSLKSFPLYGSNHWTSARESPKSIILLKCSCSDSLTDVLRVVSCKVWFGLRLLM